MITNLNYGNFNYNKNWFDTLMFIDFDGTVIRTYTNDMIQSLTDLPPIPNHTTDDIPLTSQGWNWTLSEIKSYNLLYPDTVITVGPLYCTTDGKTHIICKPGDTKIRILHGTAEIEWPDGRTETITNNKEVTHYCSGSDSSHYTIRPISWDSDYSGIGIEFRSDTYHIRCGQNVSIINTQAGLKAADSLEDISISEGLNNIGIAASSDYRNHKLKAIVLPKVNTNEGAMITIARCDNLRAVASSYSRVKSNEEHSEFHVESCAKFCRYTVPDGVNRVEAHIYDETAARNKISIGGGAKIIERATAYNDLTIGSNIITIENLRLYPSNTHILTMKRTTPPTALLIQGPRLIYVPYSSDHSVLNAYKTASEWSDFADIIQEEPQ